MKLNRPGLGLGLGLVNLVRRAPDTAQLYILSYWVQSQTQLSISSSASSLFTPPNSKSRLLLLLRFSCRLVYFSFSRSRRSWLLMEKISVGVRFRPLASSCDSDSGRKWQISDKVISLCHFNTPVSGLTFSFGIFLSPPSNHKLSLNFLSLSAFTFTDSLRFLFVCLPHKYVYMFLLMQIMCLIRLQVM